MSASIHRTPKSSGRQSSLFFNDLATPVTNRGRSGSGAKFTTPGQAAAVSALWRENFATSDLPPPPVFTLEDRSDFSPESGIQDYSVVGSPERSNSNPRTPPAKVFSSSPNKSSPPNSNPSTSSYALFKNQQSQQNQSSPPGGSSWWSAARGGGDDNKGSPVDGVVHRQPGALVILPPPREVARPEQLQRNSALPFGTIDEEEWVTIYGFSPADTNLVLREFEKCGVILKHVPGPRDSNWMHILYQSRFDAQKALSKNGMQLNGALIIGVKPVDPMQRQALTDRLNNNHGGFMPLPPPTTATTGRTSTPPYYPNGNNANTSQSMATPSKSVISRLADLMFGM